MKHGFFAFWTCFLAFLSGCALFCGVLSVTVPIPAMPPCWEGAAGWKVSQVTGTSRETSVELPGSALRTELPPGSSLILSAAAVFPHGCTRPFGTVWPYIKTDGGCELDAAGGFCAELASMLSDRHYDISAFNWQRLHDELLDAEADYWDLDIYALARAIEERGFRLDMITRKPARFAVRLFCPAGRWRPTSPNEATLDGGTEVGLSLSSGTHTWFCDSGMLTVLVDGKGRATVSY